MHHGIVLLDKPLGLSSSAATQRVRHLLGRVRAGHIGSLDPLATGMLPICIGEATKIAGVVLDGRKCYRFTVRLGGRTATGDAEGPVVEQRAVPALSASDIASAMRGFCGEQSQTPPMYSAIKQQGQPLYKLARAGVTVERPARRIRIDSLQCLNWLPDAPTGAELDCRVVCGKGTYVRVLAEDLAVALGTLGHVTALRREWVEPFESLAMIDLPTLTAAAQASAAQASGTQAPEAAAGAAAAVYLPPLVTISQALPGVERLSLDPAQALRLSQGQALALPVRVPAEVLLALDEAGRALGLAERNEQGVVRAKRWFTEPL